MGRPFALEHLILVGQNFCKFVFGINLSRSIVSNLSVSPPSHLTFRQRNNIFYPLPFQNPLVFIKKNFGTIFSYRDFCVKEI